MLTDPCNPQAEAAVVDAAPPAAQPESPAPAPESQPLAPPPQPLAAPPQVRCPPSRVAVLPRSPAQPTSFALKKSVEAGPAMRLEVTGVWHDKLPWAKPAFATPIKLSCVIIVVTAAGDVSA